MTLVVLAVGLAVGLVLGLSSRLTNQSASVEQHYMLLVSDLYAQGVPLANVHDRLVSLGYNNPSVAVLAVADQLSHSQDKVSQQEADQLHQFAEALVAGPGSDALANSTAQPATTGIGASATVPAGSSPAAAAAAVSPTGTVTPSVTRVPTVVEVPTVAPVVLPSPQPTAVPTVPPAPTATTAPPPPAQATAAPEKPGVVHTTGHKPAMLRGGPTSKSSSVVVIPDGAKVSVYGTAHGEEVEKGDSNWYHIVYNHHQGYLYDKLVSVGG